MFRYLVTFSYDGSDYSGFQRQENANSVQEEIEKALKNMTRTFVTIHSAGRTDTNVHGINHVFHFDLNFEIDNFEIWIKGINKRLPSDIKIKKIKKVANDFHARHDAKARVYEYRIAKKPSSVFNQRYEIYIENFRFELVQNILNKFIGTKDFSGFSKKVLDKSPIKTLYSIEVRETKKQYIFTFCGESFLRHMVRTIMGLIIEIGTAKKDPLIIDEIFKTNDRTLAGKTAPAKALFLKKRIY